MPEMYTSVILVILCTSVVCAIGSQSPKTAGQKSKTNVRESLSKGTKCGISATAPTGDRIIGGEEARPHSWPWQVWIQCITKLRNRQKFANVSCGGSLVSDKWVITAAHCVLQNLFNINRDCQVILGKHDLQRNESTQLIAKIADYFIHPEFQPIEFMYQKAHDLALFKLAKPVKFTDAIQPICLPFGLPELPYNKSCYVTGWGITNYENMTTPTRLMQLSMTVTNERHCSYPIGRIICAARWEGNKNVCQGDSGGPLACQEQDRKWYLRGVVSRGKCAIWAAFTKVASFEEWIKNISSHY